MIQFLIKEREDSHTWQSLHISTGPYLWRKSRSFKHSVCDVRTAVTRFLPEMS